MQTQKAVSRWGVCTCTCPAKDTRTCEFCNFYVRHHNATCCCASCWQQRERKKAAATDCSASGSAGERVVVTHSEVAPPNTLPFRCVHNFHHCRECVLPPYVATIDGILDVTITTTAACGCRCCSQCACQRARVLRSNRRKYHPQEVPKMGRRALPYMNEEAENVHDPVVAARMEFFY